MSTDTSQMLRELARNFGEEAELLNKAATELVTARQLLQRAADAVRDLTATSERASDTIEQLRDRARLYKAQRDLLIQRFGRPYAVKAKVTPGQENGG